MWRKLLCCLCVIKTTKRIFVYVSQSVCVIKMQNKSAQICLCSSFFIPSHTPKGCQRGRGTCSAKRGAGGWQGKGAVTGTTKPLPNVIRRRSNDVPMRKRRTGTTGRVNRTEIKFFDYKYSKWSYSLENIYYDI